MTWKSKTKSVSVRSMVAHAPLSPNVAGRAFGLTGIDFTPPELFGAMARCSHLYPVNPLIPTPERAHMQALLERHVDDISKDFAILGPANRLKDFVKSYFVGSVAAGISYLAMIRDGYAWFDHFENVGGGSPGTRRKADFVFASDYDGVALMESKGSGGKLSHLDATVMDGYVEQVEPHLGHPVGNVIATHGYCIGAHLQSTTNATLTVHHTAPQAAGTAGGTVDDIYALTTVLRHNFATVFGLVHSPELARAVRRGSDTDEVQFFRLRWRGRTWLTFDPYIPYDDDWDVLRLVLTPPHRLPRFWGSKPGYVFAVEEGIARRALETFRGRPEVANVEAVAMRLPRDEVLGERLGESDGAVFPDGLALIRHDVVRNSYQDVATI